MGNHFDDVTESLNDLVDDVIADATGTARRFWDDLSGLKREDAKLALRRYGQNQVSALRNPGSADVFNRSAAHNLNELMSITAATKIDVRREARALSERIFNRILDATLNSIDILL